ncbi:unnamed protein product, partial [Choristocarpus tenellus]
RLRWLAGPLRDSVAERVWAMPAVALDRKGGERGGSVAGEAMALLLRDLSHTSMGRRVSARRALQSVLLSPPARVGGQGGGSGEGLGGRGGAQGLDLGDSVVILEEADKEQCGWLFRCRLLPSWKEVRRL